MDELLKKARHPQWVESAKENLCYRGRIMRGMELAAKAQADGDKALCEKLKAAIVALEDELDQLEQKILQAGGGTVEPCDCRYCTQNQDVLYMAESRLRRAVFSLTEPDIDSKIPDALAAYQNGKGEVIKQLAEKVAAAQHNYFVVCQQFNVAPAWGQILKAW
jgi:hypothetical protein